MRGHQRLLPALLPALLAGLCAPAYAAPAAGTGGADLEPVCRAAIQHRGRIKPFDSFARESIQLITGRPSWNGEEPALTALSMAATPSDWLDVAMIEVPFVPLREQLGMDRKAKRVSYNELVRTRALMRMMPGIVEKQQRDEKLTMLETEALDLFNRFVTFSGLIKQEFAMVPPTDAPAVEWGRILDSPHQEAWSAWLTAWQEGRPEAGARAAAVAWALQKSGPGYPPSWRIGLELWYNRHDPFAIARVIYALAALAFGLSLAAAGRRARPWAVGMIAGAYAVHGAGILVRVVLGGRPPVSNFFETMLWLPFVIVTLSLVFEAIYRNGLFGLSASALAGVTLLLASHVPLDSSIAPVVAVLRSNLWLTIHVLTIVASYGALALATGLAHLYGGWYLARGSGHPILPKLGLAIYRATQVGVVLLAGGIMLGAVWANASWGRYWGWDPKETWALITLMWYLAMLHGRLLGWIRGVGLALATIGGFFLLMMTYYGVSFYLVGLHSYAGGNAKPLPALLIGYVVAEVLFLAAVGLRARSAQAAEPAANRPSLTDREGPARASV